MKRSVLLLLLFIGVMDISLAQDTPIFTVVEEMPTYQGGDDARIRFLYENIVYPVIAIQSDIQGTVFVTFVVNEDGHISDAKILRGIGGGCDEEAIRVVYLMKNWIPGKQNDKNVRVQYNMPIKFNHNLDKKE